MPVSDTWHSVFLRAHLVRIELQEVRLTKPERLGYSIKATNRGREMYAHVNLPGSSHFDYFGPGTKSQCEKWLKDHVERQLEVGEMISSLLPQRIISDAEARKVKYRDGSVVFKFSRDFRCQECGRFFPEGEFEKPSSHDRESWDFEAQDLKSEPCRFESTVATLGRKGGSANTDAQNQARRENGALGGRPRKDTASR